MMSMTMTTTTTTTMMLTMMMPGADSNKSQSYGKSQSTRQNRPVEDTRPPSLMINRSIERRGWRHCLQVTVKCRLPQRRAALVVMLRQDSSGSSGRGGGSIGGSGAFPVAACFVNKRPRRGEKGQMSKVYGKRQSFSFCLSFVFCVDAVGGRGAPSFIF